MTHQYLPLYMLVCGVAFCAMSADLEMTSDMTVDVAAGEALVVENVSGAYQLTKTGEGILEIRRFKSTATKVVVEAGVLKVANPRPDGIFERAYFHVDARELESMEMDRVDGTNFVFRWNDVNGGTNHAALCNTVWQCRTDPEKRRPFLRPGFQNGLPVVDFGPLLTKHLTNEVGEATGYGAAMEFNVETPSVKEAFSVFADTDDVYELMESGRDLNGIYPMSVFSHETDYRFVRHDLDGDNAAGLISDNSQNNGYYKDAASGAWNIWFDGTRLSSHPKNKKPSEGFHICRIRPIGSQKFNNFAAEFMASGNGGNRSYGGQRIAEYVLFTEESLTDEEAETVNRYLRVKWFPQSVASVLLRKGASMCVEDGVSLAIGSFTDEGADDLSLQHGSNTVDSLLSVPSWIHLDSSRSDTMTVVSSNGTNFVSRWNDVTGNGRYAVSDPIEGKWGQRTNPKSRMPFLSPEIRQNNLPVIDFGSAIFTGCTNEFGEATGYGGAFKLSASAKVAEYMAVIADREDLKDIPSEEGPSYIAYYSGNSYAGQNEGRRGRTKSAAAPSLFFKVSGSNNKVCIDGTNLVNGVEQQYTYSPPFGFNVINLRPAWTIGNCNLIARTLRTDSQTTHDTYGGQRIAEYMIFPTLLEGHIRDFLYSALRVKWFGDEPMARTYRNLSLAGGAVLSVVWEAVDVTGRLRLGDGALSARSVSAKDVQVTGSARVESALSLPDGAKFTFTRCADGSWPTLFAESLDSAGSLLVEFEALSASGLNGTEARIVTADRLPGSIGGWKAGSVNGRVNATLSLREDGVWVKFRNPGTCISIR